MSRRITYLVLVALFAASSCFASPIYKWTDEDGNVHFSTKKTDPRAQLADLPPINRGDLGVAKRKLISCEKHGGVDCKAGPDSDGSVICFDGFRGATPRFRFNCLTPKLEITEVTERGLDGKFSVFVRNSKGVVAEGTEVAFRPSGAIEYLLRGPSRIDEHGLEEFEFIPNSPESVVSGPVSFASVEVRCSNCP